MTKILNLGRVAKIVEVNVGVKATPPEMKKSEFRVAEIVEGNLKVKVSFQFEIWED